MLLKHRFETVALRSCHEPSRPSHLIVGPAGRVLPFGESTPDRHHCVPVFCLLLTGVAHENFTTWVPPSIPSFCSMVLPQANRATASIAFRHAMPCLLASTRGSHASVMPSPHSPAELRSSAIVF